MALPFAPPVLLRDDLRNALERVIQAAPLQGGELIDDEAWELLQQVVAGTVLFRRGAAPGKSLRAAYRARDHLHRLDAQQEQIGKQVPPGPQRIRGIAGSGKTVLICQKAALMHLKHPDWDIALTFSTQSLYDTYRRGLDQWLRRYTGGERGYDPETSKVKVLHAWGRRDQPGLYREMARRHEVTPVAMDRIPEAERGSPLQNYAWALQDLLTTLKKRGQRVQPVFDAILVDEGQDLGLDNRSCEKCHPEIKKLTRTGYFHRGVLALTGVRLVAAFRVPDRPAPRPVRSIRGVNSWANFPRKMAARAILAVGSGFW